MSQYDTDALVSRVRRRTQLPTNAYTDQQILDVAYEEILTAVLPALKRTRENYRLARTDIATVADQGDYRIPTRAQGGALRTVSLVRGDDEFHLAKLSLDDLEGRRDASGMAGFVVNGDKISILPTPDVSTDYIRVRYQLAFPRLVPTAEAGLVTSVNVGGGTTTISTGGLPSSWVTGDDIDVIEGRSGFEVLVTDADTTIAGSAVSISGSYNDIQAGDWVALAGESPIITLPDVLHPAVYGYTASRILFEVGEKSGGGVERGMAQNALERAIGSISPRTDGRARRIVNRRSTLRIGRGR